MVLLKGAVHECLEYYRDLQCVREVKAYASNLYYTTTSVKVKAGQAAATVNSMLGFT